MDTSLRTLNRFTYARGLIRCPACERFLDPKTQANEIEDSSKGHHYHKREYCRTQTVYPPRLRYLSHGIKARRERQAKATYY